MSSTWTHSKCPINSEAWESDVAMAEGYISFCLVVGENNLHDKYSTISNGDSKA